MSTLRKYRCQPNVVLNVGTFVENAIVGREIETPNSILAFVTGDREEQVEYIEGMIGIGVFLTCLIAIWFLTLLLIKCQGRERMGCAAGYAFHDSESDDRAAVEERKQDGEDASVGAAVDPDDSVARDDRPREERESRTSSKLSSRFSSLFAFGKKKKESSGAKTNTQSSVSDNKVAEENELHMELDNLVESVDRKRESQNKDGEPWSLHSIPKAVEIGDESVKSGGESTANGSIKKTWGQTFCCSAEPKHVERRKFLTRSFFALFAVISMMCCLLLITNMYRPLESAALTSSEVILETTQIVDELNGVLEVFDNVTVSTSEILGSLPSEHDDLCPNLSSEEFEGQYGFNTESIITTVSTEYELYLPVITDSLTTAKDTLDSLTSILLDINESIGTANQYLWIIPLIICITILIIFSQLALMLAVIYREEKFKDIQTTVPKVENCFGWSVLPLQIFVVVVSWLLVIAFCFGMILTTDSCVPSFSSTEIGINNGRGTPDDVVLAVVDRYVDSETDELVVEIAKERLATYITGCEETRRGLQETDPLGEIIFIQELLIDTVEDVDTQVSFATDVLGLQFIELGCGPDNEVSEFFAGLSLLNEEFFNVIMAIKLGYDAVSCPRINALYVKTVYDAFCTDFATANATGLVLLIMISFSGMVLITLRASWRSAE